MAHLGPLPSPKEVVVAIMKFEGRELRTVKDKRTGEEQERVFLKYRCPRPACLSPMVIFQDKAGYRNPYQHLRACYGRGKRSWEQDQLIKDLFVEARTSMEHKGGTILSHFNTSALTPHDIAVYETLRYIVMTCQAISHVDSPEFRRISKHGISISRQNLTRIIFALTEAVEHRIGKEMKGTCGALMYDGWTTGSMHYVGLFASYCTTVVKRVNNQDNAQSVPRLTLLGVSPLGKVSDDTMNDDEATKFDAEAHIAFFRDVMKFYNCDFSKWCHCFIADNASVNLRISRLSKKPHVGCISHKLNLEVNHMVQNHADMERVINSIHETMRAVKMKIKMRLYCAILRRCVQYYTTQRDGRASSKCFASSV